MMTVDQLTEFFAQIKAGRVTGDVLQRMLENPDRYREGLGRFGRIWPVAVNFDLGFDGLMRAAKFDQEGVNTNITSQHFPVAGKGVRDLDLELYEFDKIVTGEDAARKIEEDGYQNEDLPALLAFGAKYPVEQRRRPIVALGSRWQDGDRNVFVSCLVGFGDKRELDLSRFVCGFGPHSRFLVSRKAK